MAKAKMKRRWRQFVRNFKQNGIRLLLEHPENLCELLNLLDQSVAERIDFSKIQAIKTTFVRRDFRHIESDMLFTAPLMPPSGRGRRGLLWIYLLLEHQSEPDRLMPLRLPDYQIQVFRYQQRQWTEKQQSPRKLMFHPVLPIVFYTGTRPWPSVGTMTDLIHDGANFRKVTAAIEQPLFINLPEIDPGTLERQGGYFGTVMTLLKYRTTRPAKFQEVLRHVVEYLEDMSTSDRLRWLDFLSYIHAMIYPERSQPERRLLQETIEQSVQTDPLRQEIHDMGQTIAEYLIEEGKIEGKIEGVKEGEHRALRTTLLKMLEQRFGALPPDTERLIQATENTDVLSQWLDRVITAKSLKQIGIQ